MQTLQQKLEHETKTCNAKLPQHFILRELPKGPSGPACGGVGPHNAKLLEPQTPLVFCALYHYHGKPKIAPQAILR